VQRLGDEFANVELVDDTSREGARAAGYANGELAAATADALRLFLNELRRYPLLTAAERSRWRSESSAATQRRNSG